MSASNYPPGVSDSTIGTPWNEPTVPEREFDVTISQTLSRDTSICTDDYLPEFEEETGCTYANTEDTDWRRAYNNAAMTPLEIIEAADKIAKALIEQGKTRIGGVYLKDLVKECEGWVEDDIEVMEN